MCGEWTPRNPNLGGVIAAALHTTNNPSIYYETVYERYMIMIIV
jgi:hypothetical protein